MAIPNVNVTFSGGVTYSVSGTPINSNFTGTSASGTPLKKVSYTAGGAVANGANEIYAAILSITASGSSTVNLQSLTDVVANTGVVLVRLKGYYFQLLSTTDDPTNGTACTGVTIGNAGLNPHPLNLGAAANTILLGNGEHCQWETPLAAGITVSATVKNVLFTNTDAGHAAAVLVVFLGSDV